MKSTEPLVAEESFYYLHTPSRVAETTFFSPTVLGRFRYLPGYRLSRSRFDSFLLLFVENGILEVETEGGTQTAVAGELVLLDCYIPHAYGTEAGCETLWLHFDGVLARSYYELLTGKRNFIFHPEHPLPIRQHFLELLADFSSSEPADEAAVSLSITTILHALFPVSGEHSARTADGIRKAASFIDTHFSEQISLPKLAALAGFSPYHFTRLFKKETGLTPHQYVIESRLAFAKYELASTERSIAEIAEKSGFIDASAFCLTFKTHEGMTPGAYRKHAGAMI